MDDRTQRDESPATGLLIRGGRVLDPANNVDAVLDILVRAGRIVSLGRAEGVRKSGKQSSNDNLETFDATGLCVSPGFIDLHVHLREPGQVHKETIASGTAAAAAGGFASVCAMPNTEPVNDSPEITAWMQSPQRGAHVNVFPVAAATVGSRGEDLTDYRALQKAGAVAVTDDGRPILDDKVMRKALVKAAALGIPVIQHAEDTRLTAGGVMNPGRAAFILGLRGMPEQAETSIVERDIALAAATGARLHVAHISSAGALEAVRRAKRQGLKITCEVTPHHFSLSDDALLDPRYPPYDSNLKMNPPLRGMQNLVSMQQGIQDGTIDAIATDHAPHAWHEKQVEFERAPFGITGLETALGLAIAQLHVRRQIPLLRIIELLTANPARIVDLDGAPGVSSERGRSRDISGRGSLSPGAVADITIFDPKKEWVYRAEDSLSLARNSPFDGWRLTGKVVATIVAGRFVYCAGK